MTKSATCAVEPLLPVELGPGKIKFAQGVKAGPLGLRHRADGAGFRQRHRAGRAGGTRAACGPAQAREGGAAHLRESRRRAARRRHRSQQSRAHRPILHDRESGAALSAGPARISPWPHPALDIDRAAGPAAAGRRHEHPGHGRHPRQGLRGRAPQARAARKGVPTSGYSAAVTVGDFIFLPGITSLAVGDEPRRNGVAAAALMTEGAQWAGQPIKLETEFIITKRMVASLALAGAKLEDVVHAQVYLTDREDYSAFNETWTRHFGEAGPTVSIIPCIEHGLAPYDGKIEINVIAAKPGSAAGKRHVDAGVATAFRHQPQAVKAGDLLFIPALMAADRDGLVRAAAVDPRQPYFSSSAEAQAEVIIDNIDAALRGRRDLARQRGARAAVPHRHCRLLSGLQSVGAPARRPSAAVLCGGGAGPAAGAGRDGDDGSLGLCGVEELFGSRMRFLSSVAEFAAA